MPAPLPVPPSLPVRRVLGGRPFAEIGEPVAAERSEERGEVAVGGELGDLQWPGRDVAGWHGHRVGVYGTDALDCRRLVSSRWPVRSLAFHPSLPLLAVGTGDYDGGYMFEGELLLVDLTDGRTVSALEHDREVRRVRWRQDGRALELLLAPPDEDTAKKPFTRGFEALVERADWRAVTERSVTSRELGGSSVKAGHDRGPAKEAARDLVAGLAGGRSPRRQVWAVEALADGRVLAALEGTALECWLPSGEPAWSVPDPDGGRQLAVCPGEAAAWVNVPRRRRWTGSDGEDVPSTVDLLSLADGSTLGSAQVPFPASMTSDDRGWIALRDTRDEESKPALVLISPEREVVAGPTVGGYDLFNHHLEVRRGPELLFIQGKRKKPWKERRFVSLAPETGGGKAKVREHFPLEWDTERNGRLFGGPAVRLSEGGEALVHAGWIHHGHGLLPGNAFIARRGFPDGTLQWAFTGDHPATALDTDGRTVYAALTSGEVLALDAVDGAVLWRSRAEVCGVPTVVLSLTVSGGGELVLGTVDGRILLCPVGGRG
ncbi:PQQ-binding-like beta-propeller repeat protein [Kitasatospora sp. NPDC004289]